MPDKPILFSGPMVQALLDGRKTQTRRIVKPQPPQPFSKELPGSDFGLCPAVADGVQMHSQNDYERLPKHPTKWDLVGSVGVARDAGYPRQYRAPYAVGDRLYVREAWYADEAGRLWLYGTDGLENEFPGRAFQPRKRPSIHMPRWASRLTLTVTEVRCQRLQEISEEDAVAEGVEPLRPGTMVYPQGLIGGSLVLDRFARLWNSINGPGAWDANPWVWAVSFECARRNIDGGTNG